jgi:hypothetical protein
VIGVSMTSFAVAEIGYDERDYDNWLVTLVQASERLDVLQTVVNELRGLCEREARRDHLSARPSRSVP